MLTKTRTRTDWKRRALALTDCLASLAGLVDALLDASADTGVVGYQQHRTARRKQREAMGRVAKALGVDVETLDRGKG